MTRPGRDASAGSLGSPQLPSSPPTTGLRGPCFVHAALPIVIDLHAGRRLLCRPVPAAEQAGCSCLPGSASPLLRPQHAPPCRATGGLRTRPDPESISPPRPHGHLCSATRPRSWRPRPIALTQEATVTMLGNSGASLVSRKRPTREAKSRAKDLLTKRPTGGSSRRKLLQIDSNCIDTPSSKRGRAKTAKQTRKRRRRPSPERDEWVRHLRRIPPKSGGDGSDERNCV